MGYMFQSSPTFLPFTIYFPALLGAPSSSGLKYLLAVLTRVPSISLQSGLDSV